MTYAEWAEIEIETLTADLQLTVKNVQLDWGKFYDCQNKDNEIDPSSIEGMTISYEQMKTICSCGRSSSPTGTEGSFDLFDKGTKIGNYYWDCPWSSARNTVRWKLENSGYVVQANPGADGGALGRIYIHVTKN